MCLLAMGCLTRSHDLNWPIDESRAEEVGDRKQGPSPGGMHCMILWKPHKSTSSYTYIFLSVTGRGDLDPKAAAVQLTRKNEKTIKNTTKIRLHSVNVGGR